MVAASREDFYARISGEDLAPLWEVLADIVPRQPKRRAVPALWRYQDVRPYVMEAGGIVTAEEAVRRVLILENPSYRGQSRITNALYAGYQLILPGEVAPAHRHAQAASRLILEGAGAYTAVDGERTTMRPNDFILTPAWTWHDHGNDAREPVVWLDGLDVPLVEFLDTGFEERSHTKSHSLSRPEGDSLARFGANLLPADHQREGRSSPVFSYPYERTREALEQLTRAQDFDPHTGLHLRFINPVNGGDVMPTISAFVQLLPQGMKTEPYRSTDGVVFTCLEGAGTIRVGEHQFSWGPRDVFVVPGWYAYVLEAEEQSVLFKLSERGMQEKLGLWRESRESQG